MPTHAICSSPSAAAASAAAMRRSRRWPSAARSIAHGIALQPGRTAAVGRIGKTPVIALPGAPDQALAAWWTLALPALDRLSGRRPRQTVTLPLARKIASSVGIAEIVLLERKRRRLDAAGDRRPVARGDRPRRRMACRCPAAARDLLRARRSMPICCGTDMSSDMTNAPSPKSRDSVDQDQFLTILSREDALARFEAALFPRAVPSEPRQLADALGCALARGYRGADRRAAVRPLQCRRLCGALRRSCLRRRSRAGARHAERRSHRLRHRADAAGAVGNGDVDCDRRSGAARRRRRRHGRAYPARRARARSRSAAPPRPDNSCPMPAPTSRAARRCCAPAP